MNAPMPLADPRQTLEPVLFDLLDSAALLDAEPGAQQLLAYRQAVIALEEAAQACEVHGLAYAAMLLDGVLGGLVHDAQPLAEPVQRALAAWPCQVLAELFTPSGKAPEAAWQMLEGLKRLPGMPALPLAFDELIRQRLDEDLLRLTPPEALAPPLGATPASAPASVPPLRADEPLLAIALPEALPPEPAGAWAEVLLPEAQAPGPVAAPPDGADLPAWAPPASAPASPVAPEELAAMALALGELQEEVQPLLAPQAPAQQARTLQRHLEHLANILRASELLGLAGLERVLAVCLANAQALQVHGSQQAPTEALALLALWPQLAIAWLHAPHDEAAARSLAGVVSLPDWPLPASPEEGPPLLASLLSVVVASPTPTSRPRAEALPEHLSLAVPADIDRNVLDSLLQELPQQSQTFTALVQRLDSLDALSQARRVAHTLKGAGNTVGIQGVANLTHALEDVLLAFHKAERLPPPEVVAVLLEAADTLESMSESVVSAQPFDDAQALVLYRQVLAVAQFIEAHQAETGQPWPEMAPETALQAAALARQPAEAGASAALQPAAAGTGIPAPRAPSLTPAEANHEPEAPEDAFLRVPATLIDHLLRLAAETTVLASQFQDRIDHLATDLQMLQGNARQFDQLSADLEQLVDVRGGALMGVRAGELDALEMDQFNELHVLSRRVTESSADHRTVAHALHQSLAKLRDLLAEQEQLHLEMQRHILRTRMVPLSSVVPRLQRAVRQAARMVERPVELVVHGDHTQLDAQLLQRLLDPLMHLLRNAVDHGLEPPGQRQAAGKPEAGRIQLRVATQGTAIHVVCEDDGRGLDLPAIAHKARALGWLGADERPTPEQLTRLILRPGLSTRAEANLLSGRGIGLDVVARAVSALRGTLDIHSTPGQGTRFELRLPLQLSATQVMITRRGELVLALSVRGVEQLLPAAPDLAEQADGTWRFLGPQGRGMPAVWLEQLLGLPERVLHEPGAPQVVMLVRDEERQPVAIVVPELDEARSLVVKPLNPVLPVVLGVEGAAILGDGAVACVLDLPDLLRDHAPGAAAPVAAWPEAVSGHAPLCLVVDDSVSVRRTMEHLMQDAGYEVLPARDGLEALGLVQHHTPDVVLVDLEMPRMNGLEFTQALRNRPETRHTPVIMITSRFTQRHERLAQEAGVSLFLTKPYAEERLLSEITRLLQQAHPSEMA